tara:strand:- start:357 stop:764 length:408 start_codon:yes stop_codon:yes gene_type:complete
LLIKNPNVKCTWRREALLGEGVLWVGKLNSIIFVDIKKKQILIYNYKTKRKKILKIDKEIGFISQINKETFVLGLKSEIRIVKLKNLKTLLSISIEQNKINNRINDGKVDPAGRLWFGTMDNLEKKKNRSSILFR